ncbi:hypothetical protein MMC17_006238 [Xylographa soralifera]|nr:hypothetical protein [Xylographa soralifera]
MARTLLAVRFTGSSPDIERSQKTKPPKHYMLQLRTSSPLLRLPYDVSRIIWRLLLGDNTIHLIDTEKAAIWQGGRRGTIPGHVICGVDDGHTASHEKCLGHIYCTPVTSDYKHCKDCTIVFNLQQVDLRVLRTCSDVYAGANEVLLSTNTFYFDYNFRPSMLKRLWGSRFSTAMKRIRLTLPVNWRFSLEIRRLLDMVEILHSCRDLQIDLHQNSWIPDYYQYRILVGPFGLSRSQGLFTEMYDLLASYVFDDVEVLQYEDSSFGPENLPATCRHHYDSAELLQVGQFEQLLQWSSEDASLVNEYGKP